MRHSPALVSIACIGLELVTQAQSGREEAIQLARETLVRQRRLTVTVDVREATSTTWRDSALGCPRPGVVSRPVTIDGYRVVLSSADGTSWTVHVGGGEAVICGPSTAGHPTATPAKPAAAETARNAAAGLKLAEQARDSLARRLGIRRDLVRIVSYRATTWPDAGLGCPPAGPPLPLVETPGFVISLHAAGRTYEFHSDMTRAVACDSTALSATQEPRE